MSDNQNSDAKKVEQAEEIMVFRGKIGEVIHLPQPDGRVFEVFRRPPGVRLIIISKDQKILITREYRREINSVDLRLPGGKVCDTLKEYDSLRASKSNLVEAARAAAVREASEETGLKVRDLELIAVAGAGATVEWDLYYFKTENHDKIAGGQSLEQGENIEVTWMSARQIRAAIEAGQMQEWRTVGILLGKILPRIEGGA